MTETYHGVTVTCWAESATIELDGLTLTMGEEFWGWLPGLMRCQSEAEARAYFMGVYAGE
jgi:hypothetical protein